MNDGFQRGIAAPTTFYHPKSPRASRCAWKRLHVSSHGVGAEEGYDVKVRGILGSGKRGVREIEMFRRSLRWTERGRAGVRGE